MEIMSVVSSTSVDSGTRRAFALDSRAVWIEQQIRHQILLPKDNLAIGPAEYSPTSFRRHVSTPLLGKYNGPADHFRSFQSSAQLHTPAGSRQKSMRSEKVFNDNCEHSDFRTIFHSHDTRNPLDPKLRFCQTPGPYLTHGSALETVSVDGIQSVKDTVRFGRKDIPFGARNPLRQALPDYDVNFDSKLLRPQPRLTSFSKSKRETLPARKSADSEGTVVNDTRASSSSRPRSRSPLHHTGSTENMSVFQQRCSMVVLPKLRTRKPPTLIFDSSSYRRSKSKMPDLLTPNVVKKKAKVDLFHHLLAIPKQHRSAQFNS
jgi:hypothetical protein